MPSPLVIKSPLLKPLDALASVQKGGAAYYKELRHSSDRYIAAGAWCAMLENKLLSYAMEDEVFAYCSNAAVRSRAFSYFQSLHEHTLARRAAETPVSSAVDIGQTAMLAELALDDLAAANAAGDLYLATGDLSLLRVASEKAEIGAGWRASLEWAVRAVVIAPLQPATFQRLFTILSGSAQPELLEEAASIMRARNLHLQMAQLFLANAAILQHDARSCLALLKPFDDARVSNTPALKPYLGAVRAMRAESEERLGNFTKALEAYAALNAAERSTSLDPKDFYKAAAMCAKLTVPELPPPKRMAFQMLGFPRSGTTLLENVLATHPQIETFEETQALTTAVHRVERALLYTPPQETPEQIFSAARDRYYEELDMLRRKPEARVLVDKMPIRTADTGFVVRLFPEWRYIFSIRHPFDVVLSCFKQRFTPNPAMENFRTIEGSVRLYDFAMTEWFNHHMMDDPNVHYVRYDELVTDFERVTAGTLSFLGVPWDGEVRNFARTADSRAAKTPSYQKVRQGLSIGVQSAWRNYGFVFQSPVAKPLHKWAAFFGYPTE